MSLLAYLLKVIIVSAIFFGYYRLFLRNKRFHHYNRFFLLGALLLSIVLPFIRIPLLYNPEDPVNDAVYRTVSVINTDYVDEAAPVNESVFTLMNSVSLAYAIGVLFLMTLVVKSLLYIRSLRQRYPAERITSLRFYNTHEPGTPFSFFRSIFWNDQLSFNSPEGQQIFRHELFHVQHRHSADRLLAEIVTAIFWFNPFFHLIKKELKAIHEFLADQFAISGSDRYAYATLLVQQALESGKHTLTNHFFQNHIKRRIAMITQFKQSDYGYWSRVMILPVSILLFCFITLYAEKPAMGAEVKKVVAITGNTIAIHAVPGLEQNKDTVPEKLEKERIEQKIRQAQLQEIKKKMIEQEQVMRKAQQAELGAMKKQMQEHELLAREREQMMKKRQVELEELQQKMENRQEKIMKDRQEQIELIEKIKKENEDLQHDKQHAEKLEENKKRIEDQKQNLEIKQQVEMETMKHMMREVDREREHQALEQKARQAELQKLKNRIMEQQKIRNKQQQLELEKMKEELRRHEEELKNREQEKRNQEKNDQNNKEASSLDLNKEFYLEQAFKPSPFQDTIPAKRTKVALKPATDKYRLKLKRAPAREGKKRTVEYVETDTDRKPIMLKKRTTAKKPTIVKKSKTPAKAKREKIYYKPKAATKDTSGQN